MPTALSNKDLFERCKEFIYADPSKQDLDYLIKYAIVTAEQEIRDVDMVPLAWLRGTYDELFTKPYATISAITQADPGVITAESSDGDVTGHGFANDDIVFIAGVADMERLNNRRLRFTRTAATTGTLQRMDDQDDINTTDYEEYDSGGTIYHAGMKIDASAFEPSSGNYLWKMGDIFDVTIDMFPCDPISQEQVRSEAKWMQPVSRPVRFQHLKTFYDDPTSFEHLLLLYPPAGQRYNVRIHYTKDYPSISEWTSAVYPPCPAAVHDCIWHRALHILATNSQKAKRLTKDGGDNTKIEVLQAQHWAHITAQDERKIINLSRNMLGDAGSANSGVAA